MDISSSPLVDGESAASYGTDLIPVGTAVRVRVPGSTGNVGPGYDSLGLALGRYDELTVERTDEPLVLDVRGEGSGSVPRTEEHLVIRAMRTAWRAIGMHALPGLRVEAVNGIPHSRGMGSSASAIVAGVVAANAMVPQDLRLSENAMLQICSQMEGHPDNVAPSLFGLRSRSRRRRARRRRAGLRGPDANCARSDPGIGSAPRSGGQFRQGRALGPCDEG